MGEIIPLYTSEIINTGGWKGHVKSSDGILEMNVSMLATLIEHGEKTNPEQLLATGYAVCFNGAVGVVAQERNIADAAMTGKVMRYISKKFPHFPMLNFAK